MSSLASSISRPASRRASPSVRRLVRKNLAATKLRLVLTALSIVLGVSFVTSSFVLADGLRASFRTLSDSINDGTDLSLRSIDGLGEPQPISDELIARVKAVPGVAAVAGQVQTDGVQPVKANGDPVIAQAPQFGFAWIPDDKLNAFTVVEGRAPRSGEEFTLDLDSAAKNDFAVGRAYDILTPTGRHRAELVGLVRFGRENATLGATLTQFPLATAQRWLGLPGKVRVVGVRVKGQDDVARVQQAIESFAPTGTEVVNQRILTKETEDEYITNVNLIGNVLLGFAMVSLFVSSFIIANTFAIVVGQRTRELALLRALGGSRTQVRRMVLGEAAVVGLGASLAGIGVGVLVTIGLRAAFSGLGISLPDADLVVSPRTWAIGLMLGLGVTMLAAVRPAMRAAKVAPVTAMSASVAGAEAAVSSRSAGVGLAVMFGGAALVAFGQQQSSSAELLSVGIGVVALVGGVLRLAPLFVRPVLRVVGAPVRRLLRHSGKLALVNSMRNPRRTVNTGAALMIGLSVVAGALVVGESIKRHLANAVSSTVAADVLITSKTDTGVPLVLSETLRATPGFAAIGEIRPGEVRLDGNKTAVQGLAFSTSSQLFNLDFAEGSLTGGRNTVALSVDKAERLGVGIGDLVDTEFPIGPARALTVTAIYRADTLLGDAVLDLATWDQVSTTSTANVIAGRYLPTVTAAPRSEALTRLADALPQMNVETGDQFTERISGQVDQLLAVVNLMVVLTIIIALLGITNTLALAVIERTRELGLLRAVGMSRRAMRRTVRWEAALIAAFGALLGLGLGLVLGWIGVQALPDNIATAISVPYGSLAVLTSAAVIAAILAAQFPARRAARLDVLKAIAR